MTSDSVVDVSTVMAGTSEPADSDSVPAVTTPDTEGVTVEAAKIGSTITLRGSESEVAVTVTEVMDPVPPGEFFAPDPGYRYVGLQLRLVNSGSTFYVDSPSNGAKVLDGDRQEYSPDVFVDTLNTFGSVWMAPGDTRLGWIGFQLPEAVTLRHFTLALDSGYAEEIGEWDITVGTPGDPAPAVTRSDSKIGDAINLTGFDDLEMTVTLRAVVDNATPADEYSAPRDGFRYVAVQFQLANSGTTPYADSPSNGVKLIDAVGQEYSPTYATTTDGPLFEGTVQVPPEDFRVGWIVFEIPKDQNPAKLQMALDSGFAEDIGEWSTVSA